MGIRILFAGEGGGSDRGVHLALFIPCAEILGNAIRADTNIGGIRISVGSSEHETKLIQYADDTNIFLDGEVSSLCALLALLTNFRIIWSKIE